MSQNMAKHSTDLARRVIDHLRHSPGTRSAVYLGGATALLEIAGRVQDVTHRDAIVRVHLMMLPFGAAWTYVCRRIRPEDRISLDTESLRRGIMQSLQGAGLGTGVFLVLIGAAAARGWVSAPAWGWERTSVRDVGRSVALLTIGHLAVAWNEETVFRGYGFETLQDAIGTGGAMAVLVPLFALTHGTQGQVLLGQAAIGTTLTLLRLHSGGIWLPVGYHWAWNVVQTAVLGASDSAPSLRPVDVHGPYRWLGRPGHPEPGLLVTLLHLAIALFLLVRMRRGGTRWN